MIMRGYTNGPDGQVHWRVAGEATCHPDLFCLHPAPYSGLAFETIMPFLAQGRRVIAPDYPGYGGSDRGNATIESYATSVYAVIDAFSPQRAVDLLGFHTGCLVATELCATHMDNIRRVALIDCPSMDPAKRPSLLASIERFQPTAELACLEQAWHMGITRRINSQPLTRAFEMFVEMLRPAHSMRDAFTAAYSYTWEEVFPRINTQVLMLATQSMLLESTRLGARSLANAKLVERLDITRAVLDEAAADTAEEVLRFLDAD